MGMMLTNMSKRIFVVADGTKFRPGTSREFEEKEAVKLLGYSEEIVRTEKALGPDAEKLIEKKDAEIARLKEQIEKLKKKSG